MHKESKDENKILPVDQRKVRGKIKHVIAVIPALDERWLCDKKFLYYVLPPQKLRNKSYVAGAKDTWISSMLQILDDIWWICELPYHKFWSQIIYDKNTLNGINSFLHLVPLQKLYLKTDDEDILLIYKRIKKAVFQFLKRISRLKESELQFLSEVKYREIMSQINIMPISRLLCVCTIYGKQYEEQTRNIVENMFQYNTNLKLGYVVQRMIQLFAYLKKRLKSAYRELKKNLYYSKEGDDIRAAVDSYRKCLVATCQYLTNIFVNISNFLAIYKPGCETFLNHDFDFHIIRVYKKLLIPLYREVDILFNDSCHILTYSWLISMLDLTRSEMIKTFNICLHSILELLSNPRTARDMIQHYIKLMKFSLKISEFLQDLNAYSNLVDMMDKIKKQCPGNVDLSEMNRISQSVLDLLNEIENTEPNLCELRHTENNLLTFGDTLEYVKESYDSEDDKVSNEDNIDFSDDDDLSSNYSDWSKNEDSDSEYECYLADGNDEKIPIESNFAQETKTTARVSEINSICVPSTSMQDLDSAMSQAKLQSAISHVKELLPHLGDGFIAMCLKEYKMDVTAVINALFEDTLPAKLKNIDFSLPTVPRHILEEHMENERDEAPSNSLKELKKVEYSSYKEMWNDKGEIAEAMRVYEQYRNVEEDELYNDDVDDSFDFDIAAQEVDTEVVYDKFDDMPLLNYNHKYSPEEESDSEHHDNDRYRKNDLRSKTYESGGIKPLDFCENPEVIRARRDHQREVKEQNRNRKTMFRNSGYRKKAFDQNRDDKPIISEDNYQSRSDDRRRERNNDGECVEMNSRREQPRVGDLSKEESNRGIKNRIKKWSQMNDNINSTEKAAVSSKSHREGNDEENLDRFWPKQFENARNEECRNGTNTKCADYERRYSDARSRNDRRPPKTKNTFGERGANTNMKQENGSEPYENQQVRNNYSNDNRQPNENFDDTSRRRHFKTVYKSRTGNHNRRYLSDRKRNF